MPRKLSVEFSLSPDEPAMQQICDHFIKLVAIGVYRPGDDLPSAQALSESLGISRTIVQQAMRTLEERGVTSAVRGGATSIAQGADTRQPLIRRMFSDVLAVARNLMPPLKQDELRDAYVHEEERHFRSRRPARTEEEPPT